MIETIQKVNFKKVFACFRNANHCFEIYQDANSDCLGVMGFFCDI